MTVRDWLSGQDIRPVADGGAGFASAIDTLLTDPHMHLVVDRTQATARVSVGTLGYARTFLRKGRQSIFAFLKAQPIKFRLGGYYSGQ